MALVDLTRRLGHGVRPGLEGRPSSGAVCVGGGVAWARSWAGAGGWQWSVATTMTRLEGMRRRRSPLQVAGRRNGRVARGGGLIAAPGVAAFRRTGGGGRRVVLVLVVLMLMLMVMLVVALVLGWC